MCPFDSTIGINERKESKHECDALREHYLYYIYLSSGLGGESFIRAVFCGNSRARAILGGDWAVVTVLGGNRGRRDGRVVWGCAVRNRWSMAILGWDRGRRDG